MERSSGSRDNDAPFYFRISYIQMPLDWLDLIDFHGYSEFDDEQTRIGGFDSQAEAGVDNGQGRD